MKLDARLETIAKEMETALTQADGLDSESFVGEKLESLQEDWTRVQADAEMLREELKEDKCAFRRLVRMIRWGPTLPHRARRVSYSGSTSRRDDG